MACGSALRYPSRPLRTILNCARGVLATVPEYLVFKGLISGSSVLPYLSSEDTQSSSSAECHSPRVLHSILTSLNLTLKSKKIKYYILFKLQQIHLSRLFQNSNLLLLRYLSQLYNLSDGHLNRLEHFPIKYNFLL